MAVRIEEVTGDLLQQDVEVIVNPWNRNIIPWWLLLPQGVSGALKKQAGREPFREVARCGPIPLGQARWTGAGRLSYRGIIHVAGINMFWIATRYSITAAVKSAMELAADHHVQSLAFPLIGAGSGNRGRHFSKTVMLEAFDQIDSAMRVILVIYERQ